MAEPAAHHDSRTVRELPGVGAMFTDVAEGAAVFRPSAFWEHYNEVNVAQIERDGFDLFKRTINQNYFSWVPHGRDDDQYDSVRHYWRAAPTLAPWLPRRIDTDGLRVKLAQANPLGSRAEQRGHARYLALLWEAVRQRDQHGLLDRLEEPELGSPITIRYRRRRISQDLCNSVAELYAATEAAGAAHPNSVIELGGGYGRIAWVFLRHLPTVRYLMVDIAPALAIAQRYLTTLFPECAAFTFRRFEDYAEVADEFEAAQLAFVTPGQFERLPPQHADLFVNVSSLHEMHRAQILRYYELIDRHCDGIVYSKQWHESVNEYDGIVVREEDYPVPSSWTQLYTRTHPIQRRFFESAHRVGAA